MNAFLELLGPLASPNVAEASDRDRDNITPTDLARENTLDREPMQGLVRQVFLSGLTRGSQQVVFAPVDEQTQITSICTQVAECLADQVSGAVCLLGDPATEEPGPSSKQFGTETVDFKDSSQQLSHNLWKTSNSALFRGHAGAMPAHSLADRMERLSLEFDYAVLQAPPASSSGVAELLGSLSDGVVLVLRAHSTRRAVAKSVKERLIERHVKILGTVLTERTFPIPELLYRRF